VLSLRHGVRKKSNGKCLSPLFRSQIAWQPIEYSKKMNGITNAQDVKSMISFRYWNKQVMFTWLRWFVPSTFFGITYLVGIALYFKSLSDCTNNHKYAKCDHGRLATVNMRRPMDPACMFISETYPQALPETNKPEPSVLHQSPRSPQSVLNQS
jgi:hypothetical protein